jgi:hypothetical protein
MVFNNRVVDVYSDLHTPILYTNNSQISFDGSQKQSEFFSCWDFIREFYLSNDKKNISFLEIGAWKGLWGIAFNEFCKELGAIGSYTTVTLMDNDFENLGLVKTIEYLKSDGLVCKLINGDSNDIVTVTEVTSMNQKFDIILIDADHKYSSVMMDISNYFSLANDMVIFHDIKPEHETENIAVYKAITDSNLRLSLEFSHGDNNMGIGLIIK